MLRNGIVPWTAFPFLCFLPPKKSLILSFCSIFLPFLPPLWLYVLPPSSFFPPLTTHSTHPHDSYLFSKQGCQCRLATGITHLLKREQCGDIMALDFAPAFTPNSQGAYNTLPFFSFILSTTLSGMWDWVKVACSHLENFMAELAFELGSSGSWLGMLTMTLPWSMWRVVQNNRPACTCAELTKEIRT